VLTHGTTIGTNALIQRKGARVGLITTKGHEDVIHIMRGSRGVVSRDIAKVVHFPESQKPVPIVPKKLIEGRVRADRLLRRGRRAAQRGGNRAGDPPAHRAGCAGDRRVFPVVVSNIRSTSSA